MQLQIWPILSKYFAYVCRDERKVCSFKSLTDAFAQFMLNKWIEANTKLCKVGFCFASFMSMIYAKIYELKH